MCMIMASRERNWFFNDYRDLLEEGGKAVLSYVLKCGTDGKPHSVAYDEYVEKHLPRESTCNLNKKAIKDIKGEIDDYNKLIKSRTNNLKKQFNREELEQIKNENFDISVLYGMIFYMCESVAENRNDWSSPSEEMEHFVWAIKKKRNICVHQRLPSIQSNEEFHKETAELTGLFLKTLQTAKNRYKKTEEELAEKKDKVQQIVKEVINETQQRAARNSLPSFKTEINSELQDCLSNAKYLDPLQFLNEYEDYKVDVETVFSKIDVINEKNKAYEIDYLEILNITKGEMLVEGPRPHLMLIEGDAGSGKTTLTTFIVSQWLKEECDRRLVGLDRFELLLRVICREESGSSLKDFLIQVLPESSLKYGNYLMLLIKRCKVLFLIDGLDEMNDASNSLVTDIIREGKQCTNFTVLCTSRPEAVISFRHRTSSNYQISNVRIVGISPSDRTQLVIKHYEWLARRDCNDTVIVEEGKQCIKDIMKEIGWMDLFRLPLNLLFVAAVFHKEPASVNTSLTQPHLYRLIHGWHMDKLLHRLYSKMSKATYLDPNINKVLEIAYQIALKGLLEKSIYLSKKDEETLALCCVEQGLPTEEVMPAIYSLRQRNIHGLVRKRYCFPHKGFQDFFAAQHILKCLNHYEKGGIRQILKDTVTGSDLCLQPLRSMLCHLLGLLESEAAVKETVDLLRECGVEYSMDWLAVVAGTAPCSTALEHITWNIESRTRREEIVEITDDTFHAAATLLPLISACSITVMLERISQTPDLQHALAHHKVVKLWHQHIFRHPSVHASSGTLLQQIPSDNLENFQGLLDADHLSLLPSALKELSLAVASTDHASTLLPALFKAHDSFKQLSKLCVHISARTQLPEDVACQLPNASRVCLVLSGVSENKVDAACITATALAPLKKEYSVIRFPGAELSEAGWQRLVQRLAEAGLRVRRGLRLPAATTCKEQFYSLNSLTKMLLFAKGSRRQPECMIWG